MSHIQSKKNCVWGNKQRFMLVRKSGVKAQEKEKVPFPEKIQRRGVVVSRKNKDLQLTAVYLLLYSYIKLHIALKDVKDTSRWYLK